MDLQWEWGIIASFGSLRERDCFVAWMQDQIASGVAEVVEAPLNRRFMKTNAGSGISRRARSGASYQTRTHLGQASGLRPHTNLSINCFASSNAAIGVGHAKPTSIFWNGKLCKTIGRLSVRVMLACHRLCPNSNV
jgi:hypothetical protein